MWSKVGSATRPQSKERKMWAAHLRMRTPVAYPTNGPGYRAPKFPTWMPDAPSLLNWAKATPTSRIGEAKWGIPGSKNHGTFRSTSSGPGRSSDCPAVERGRNVKGEINKPKLSSWSFIPASFGRYIHAMSARLRPIVQLKCGKACNGVP